MLKLENVSARYPHSPVLRSVSLKVSADDFIVILGPNGAGKSTLLKAIMNVVPSRTGRITLDGEEVMDAPAEVLVRKGIGYVPQGRVVFPNLSVEENIRMGGYVLSRSEVVVRLREVFALFPSLASKKHLPAGSLSGGQQQMVSLARALMLRPRILLLDEPSLGLAPLVLRDVFTKLLELHAAGIGIVLVEQNAHQAVKLAKKIVVLDQGRIVLEGGPEVLENQRIKELYLGH